MRVSHGGIPWGYPMGESHEGIPWGNPIGEFHWEFRVTSLGGVQHPLLILLILYVLGSVCCENKRDAELVLSPFM